MRKDLIIGLSVSVLVHYSVLFLTNTRSAPKRFEAETAEVLKIEMPTLPPEEPEKKPSEEPQDEDAVVSTIAPPSLVEIPNVVPNAVFVMTPEPPPPRAFRRPKGSSRSPPTPALQDGVRPTATSSTSHNLTRGPSRASSLHRLIPMK